MNVTEGQKIDDDFAMALIKKYFLIVEPDPVPRWGVTWLNTSRKKGASITVRHCADLNQAIVQCVVQIEERLRS